jgi:hypothetical protein
MGGSSATTQTEAPTISGFPAAPGTYTMQPAPPGFLEALAAELQAGYGGNQRAYLDTIYRPMTFPAFQAVGMQVAAPAAVPAEGGGLGAAASTAPHVGTIPYEQLISRGIV